MYSYIVQTLDLKSQTEWNLSEYTCQIPFIAQHVDHVKLNGLDFVLPEENKRNVFKLYIRSTHRKRL